MTIRVGVLGYGSMGRIRARTAAAMPGVEVVAVHDPMMATGIEFPVRTSIDSIVNDESIDAIFVCLPNFLNMPVTVAALKTGKHVFCEKPPAVTAAQVEEIRAVEAATGRILMYGFNHRQHGGVLKMKSIVDSGQYGKVLWMRGRYGKSVDADYLKGWRASKELAGGGILLDQGIHMLDLFLYIGGRPFDEVHAFVSSLYWKIDGIEDNVFAIMRHNESGLCAQLHSTMTQWRHLFSLEVFLERGYLVLNGLKTGSGSYGDEVLVVAKNRSVAPAANWQDEETYQFPIDESWSVEARQFITAISGGARPTHGSSADALEVMRLIDRIYSNDRHVSPVLYDALQPGPQFDGSPEGEAA